MSSELAPSAIDITALIHEVRRGERGAMDRAYKVTFGSDLARIVLADHLVECGVGAVMGPDVTPHAVGMHDGAILLLLKAGYDRAALAAQAMANALMGESDDGSFSEGHTPPNDYE